MSTNYYAINSSNQFPQTFTVNSYVELIELKEQLEELTPEIHLGKKSCGWAFTAAWNDGKHYKNVEEFISFINQSTIQVINEYGAIVDKEDFMQEVFSPGKRSTGRSFVEFDKLTFLKGEFF